MHRMKAQWILFAASAVIASLAACDDSKPAPAVQVAEDIPSVVDEKPALASTQGLITPPAPEEAATIAEPSPAATLETGSEPLPEGFRELMATGRGGGERALEALDRARELRPSSALPDIESARIFIGRGHFEKARELARVAIDKDESSSYAWNTLGRVELAAKDLPAAIEAFTRAVEANEDNSYAWNNLGLALMSQESWAEAASALERATSGDGPKGYMWNNLGMAYEHLNRFDLAVAAYRQAEDLGSGKARTNRERLEAKGPIGQPEEFVPSEVEPL